MASILIDQIANNVLVATTAFTAFADLASRGVRLDDVVGVRLELPDANSEVDIVDNAGNVILSFNNIDAGYQLFGTFAATAGTLTNGVRVQNVGAGSIHISFWIYYAEPTSLISPLSGEQITIEMPTQDAVRELMQKQYGLNVLNIQPVTMQVTHSLLSGSDNINVLSEANCVFYGILQLQGVSATVSQGVDVKLDLRSNYVKTRNAVDVTIPLNFASYPEVNRTINGAIFNILNLTSTAGISGLNFVLTFTGYKIKTDLAYT